MYHVLRQYDKDTDKKDKSNSEWETGLCHAISAYMAEIITLVKPTEGVYVACDGVVCAAKRRQQRLRRFKGPWIASLESLESLEPKTASRSWDQNALTPGTAFMNQLGTILVSEGARLQTHLGIDVIVSTTSEPGEGEHKLLAFLRKKKQTQSIDSVMIYGLDADLIVLSMLLHAETGASVHLLREAQEFESQGKGQEKGTSQNEWRTLDIVALGKAMIPDINPAKIRDFVATMTLLGNDFLPRSLTRTVRDNGIPILIQSLQHSCWNVGRHIIDPGGNNSIKTEELLHLIQPWAATEVQDILAKVKKQEQEQERGRGSQMESIQFQHANMSGLNRDTLTSMYKSWHPGTADAYIQGIAWTWDYYSGKPVDQTWCFDEHIPPMWRDIVAHLTEVGEVGVRSPPITFPTPLSEPIHLLSVLPMESIHRLLPPVYVNLALANPWYWPTSWLIHDIGKTQLWECDPIIPQIPECVLRKFDAIHNSNNR
jgi:5'-3' exonuclease